VDTPHGADELARAIETSWQIVVTCLDHWTVEMLDHVFRHDAAGSVQWHTRQSVIMRLITH